MIYSLLSELTDIICCNILIYLVKIVQEETIIGKTEQ